MKIGEVAEKLDLCPATVRRLTRAGTIPGRIYKGRFRDTYRFDPNQIEEFVAAQDNMRQPDLRVKIRHG